MKKLLLAKSFFFSLFVALLCISSVANAQTTETFNTSGTWVCPYGVTSIQVETWGGGGAGGGATTTNNRSGGGGGGGGYRNVTSIAVSYGTSYPYTVGAGGVGGTGNGGNGGSTTFNGNSGTTATGGSGGTGVLATLNGSGGNGGTGTRSGGTGGAGSNSNSGAGGGSGGLTSNGGNASGATPGTAGAGGGVAGAAGQGSQADGIDGGIPGAGGSGGRRGTTSNQSGGDGGAGQIKFTYVINCTTPLTQPTALSLTPSANSIAGSFTGAPTADGYLIIRTATATAPSNPVNGTNYTAGSTALGGYVEAFGAATTFNSTSLAANTQYWYWIYSMDNLCTGGTKYLTASPLTGNSFTACSVPAAQPTSLNLVSGQTSISGSFTATTANGYLVVRTATATAPTNPVNGTTYTAGTSALGGYIESVGASTTFTSSSLAANTQYWYWVFAYNNTSCANIAYRTASPLNGTQSTCTTPTAQPTALSLTPLYTTVSVSFTATPSAANYLVIRTASATAPSNPVNFTTYTAGTTALGGYVESAGAATSFTSSSLAYGTQYWYWVYAYNTTPCGNQYYLPSPLTGNTTTYNCGALTNTVTITTQGTYQWSALPWSLGRLPVSCDNAEIIVSLPGTTSSEAVTVNFDQDVNVRNFTMTNSSAPASRRKLFSTTGNKNVVINGDLVITAPGGHKFNRCVFANTVSTTVYGDVILGKPVPGPTDGHAGIGSTGSNPNQLYTLYGNMTFNPRGYTTDEWAKFVFDKAGTQYIINNTLPTDTVQPCLFENLVIGNANAANVIWAGTTFDAYMENVGRAGLTIGTNSTLTLPKNYSFNVITGGTPGYLIMNPGARLRLGGNLSLTYGVPGSNFPSGYSPYTLDNSSTIEYYGDNSITQTVYNGVTYKNLDISNGGTGRAQKNTTGAITVSGITNILAAADLTLGAAATLNGASTVATNGGLYCGANVVSGTGAFTLQTGGYLGMGHAQGITSGSTAAGNIQMTGGRSFSTGANYIYNGSLAQVTGNGLPSTCNDLTVDNPTTVTIASNQVVNGVNSLTQGTFDIGSTMLTINGAGTLTRTGGWMKANIGTLNMAGTTGTAQNLAGSWFVNRNISTLINSNTKGITVAATAGDTLLISSALLYGSGTTNSTITTNDNITLLSRDSATARFGEIVSGSSNSITGKVNVERYIRTYRKWRHLAWPTTSTQTAMQSWMENNVVANANGKPGYGTIVTDEKATWSANAFDSRSLSGPSVKYWDPTSGTSGAYAGIPNTTTYQMNSQSAYFNFVRGDRSCTPANALISPTILRSTGTLKTGNIVSTIPATKFGAVGNPYASAIDIRKIDTLNLTSTFYVWDPNLTGTYGLGAYQTIYASGTNYRVMPGGGSYGALNSFVDTLESGQAFFVRARATAGTVTFKENAKTIGMRTMARVAPDNEPALYSLLSLRDFGSNTLVDGAMASFDDVYSDDVDFDDALKMTNTSENVSFIRNGQLLAIERRKDITRDDTLFLNVSGFRVHAYQWDISMDYLDKPGRTAFFIDKYLHTETPLYLTGSNTIIFDVINSAGSYAADRFMIVFKQTPQLLPVHFTTISAVRNPNKTVTVSFTTQNELNMQDYKVERSLNGVNFTEIGTQLPMANNGNGASYNHLDKFPSDGVNYYRVKGRSTNGLAQYTAIVKVGPLGTSSSISIYPNPVTDGIVNLRFENQPKGNYSVNIINSIGQVIQKTSVSVANSNTVQMINLNNIAAGSYRASVVDESGTSSTISFIVR